MKVLFVLTLLLFSTCSFSQINNEETGTQNQKSDSAISSTEDSISMKVDQTEEFNGYGTGGGYVRAKKGYKFTGLYVYISNPGTESVNLDLKETYLLDTVNKIKYEVFSVMGTGPFTSFKKMKESLKPRKEIFRRLVFYVPKDLTTRVLLYRSSLFRMNSAQK